MAASWKIEHLRNLLAKRDMTFDQARDLFNAIMDGVMSHAQIAAVVVALAAKGETVAEIAGAAMAMRAHVVSVDAADLDALDTCGTGGTGLNTFNISTCAAMVAAGAGAYVAKHGNRTATRPSGSADVLAALGVNIDADAPTAARCLKEAGVCFCFAQKHHPAMRYAAPIRKELGVRTIFNLLGPLTNPAGARRQLMGVFDETLVETIAGVLAMLGSHRAMVVHAWDGLDELSTVSPTRVADLRDGQVRCYTLEATSLGLKPARLDDLAVADAADSARRIRAVLAGEKGPGRDIVLLNTAAALVVAGRCEELTVGLDMAAKSIDSGAALAALEKLVAISNGR
jgi:anthranilate phosphoribosyltransferase